MLDYDSLMRFVAGFGPDETVSLQDSEGRIVEIGPTVPDVHELVEVRATHFKITNRPWVTREDFMREFDAWARGEF